MMAIAVPPEVSSALYEVGGLLKALDNLESIGQGDNPAEEANKIEKVGPFVR